MNIPFGNHFNSSEENIVYEAEMRKAIAEDEDPQEKRRRLDSIPRDDELPSTSRHTKLVMFFLSPAESRNTAEAALDNIRAKREAVADDGPVERKRKLLDPQKKRRRLDSIPCESPSTSGDTESRNTPAAAMNKRSDKRKAVADDGPVERKSQILDPSAMFEAKYQQQEKLGSEGFGSLFAGYRKIDKLTVAIKHIPKNKIVFMYEDNNGKEIPMEVAVMLKLADESEWHSAPTDLLDWYDLDHELILVLERPWPAIDLQSYIAANGGCLQEKEAKIILRQLLDAAIDLKQRRIFHQDIRVENVLLELRENGVRVRVTDFGLSCFANEEDAYQTFIGTHVPPEWHSQREYQAGPSTVYQIGAVLFDMLQNPSFRTDMFFLQQSAKWWYSENCNDFFKSSLNKDPKKRLTLEQLRNHLWMR
ncbi:serine/threonine-protein kinase pim-1-like [Clinocottus analis]|uniref:serine/threonine-protein kinase pim-1-like n=1 Tax=Clinocottus analis TaxID=304258 RepID=UPI0035BFED39